MERRIPRPAFRLRTLMILVALVAVTMGVSVALKRRRDAYLLEASFHRVRVAVVGLTSVETTWLDSEGRVVSLPESDWHEALATKYQYAADHPWLPVTPDPPKPKRPNRPGHDRAADDLWLPVAPDPPEPKSPAWNSAAGWQG